jgi:hypothetical protein
MKKFLVFLLALVSICFADAVSNTADDAAYSVEGLATSGGVVVGDISSSTGYDTLAASDSVTILSNWKPEPGYEQLLVVGQITGTGSDSVAFAVRVDVKDNSGNLLYRATVDSVTSSAGKVLNLAIGTKAIGFQYDVKFKTYTGAGTQAIINQVFVFKRRPITVFQSWQAGR